MMAGSVEWGSRAEWMFEQVGRSYPQAGQSAKEAGLHHLQTHDPSEQRHALREHAAPQDRVTLSHTNEADFQHNWKLFRQGKLHNQNEVRYLQDQQAKWKAAHQNPHPVSSTPGQLG